MNLKCFFGHDWHDIKSVIIESQGTISELKVCYSSLGDVRHSDRICKKCDKIEFNAEKALEEAALVRNKTQKLKKRFDKFKEMKDRASE